MAYKNLLEWEETQIGTHNDSDGSNKYNEWFYGYRAKYPWCAVFQTCGFYEIGAYDRISDLPGKAGCENWRKWAIKKGYWSTKPKVGALVLYDWNPSAGDGADHIGIVKKVLSDGIVAIEGNTSVSGSQTDGGWVLEKTRPNSRIMGYIHIDTSGKKPEPKPIMGFDRISGKDRYNTSKATANTIYNFNAVTLVYGKDFADALSAAFFSHQKNAPILLTSPEMIDDTVKYIKERSNIDTVYVIGGEGAIPAEIEKKLEGHNLYRFSGKTRYETNKAVLDAVDTPSKQLLVASGQNFPDGICASTIDRPILLVNKSLKDYQKDYIKERGFSAFYVFGGEGAVNKTVENELREFGEVSRFGGNNRYETSRIIANKFFSKANTVVFVTGKSFADGICASNLGEYPLLFIDNNVTVEAQKYISSRSLQRAYVVGGKSVLSDNTIDWALTKYGTV